MRIIFLGSGEIGLPTLSALQREHELALVVTQPDRPAGRHREPTPTPIAAYALQHRVPLIRTPNANDPAILASIREAKPDAMVVIAFGQKLGEDLIGLPRLGRGATVNLHMSLLPKYRGAGPIQWAMIRGEKQTGLSVIHLADRMDAGAILAQVSTPIDPQETAGELHDRLAAMGPGIVLDVLDQIAAGRTSPRPQDESHKSMAPKLSKADGVVDFSQDAQAVRCRIHGLTPWPGVRVTWRPEEAGDGGGHELLLRRVASLPEMTHDAEAGRLIDEDIIATGRGAIRLLEVQPPGKRVMTWKQYTLGHAVSIGSRFRSTQET